MKNKVLSFIIIFIATIIVLYFSLKDDYLTIINTILNIDKIWLFIAFLLLFSYYILRSIVMYHFAHKLNKQYTITKAIRLTLETNFFHAITPFSTGGQPYEIYSLNKNNIKMTDAISISIQNFIVYQIALVLLGVISIICNYIFDILDSSILKNLLTLGFLINFLVIVVLFSITTFKNTNKKIINFFINILFKLKIIKKQDKLKNKIENYLNDFSGCSKKLLENKLIFILLVLLQLISLICFYLVPYAIFMGIDKYINPLTCVITMAYVMLIGSFIPIPGGTGGLEYGFVSLFGNFIKGSKLNAVMLLWRFITYYFGMILGSIIINIKKEEKQ